MASIEKQFVVDEAGRKSAVLIPIDEYEVLLADLNDLALIAERRNEPTEPLDVVTARLEAEWQSIESK